MSKVNPIPPVKIPPHVTSIWIAEDVALYSRFKRPNAWRRFWTWAFFGWRWTNVPVETDVE